VINNKLPLGSIILALFLNQQRVLPKGVSEHDFEAAIKDFISIVGDEFVSTSPAELASYSDDVIMLDPIWPSAAVRPGSVEEVQEIVKIANKYKIPLWPSSTGKNMGYGRQMAVDQGNVVIDLFRMNRILEINEELAYAVVEPGVTYAQMYKHIKDHKIPLWLDTPATTPTAGPLGNTVDRGVGYTPYGEHFLFSCGMEVVLPDGSLLKTGCGALKGTQTWHIFKWGYGPYLDGLFTQSNMGIVTKLGIWLMPEPPAWEPLLVTFGAEKNIKDAINFLKPLKVKQIIPGAVVTAHGVLCLTSEAYYPWKINGGTEGLPMSWIKKTTKEHGFGTWNMAGMVYGSKQHVAESMSLIRKRLREFPSGKLLDNDSAMELPYWDHRVRMMLGQLSAFEYGRLNWRGGGNAWCSPVAPCDGDEALKNLSLAKPVFNKHGFDYIGEFIVGWRDMHHIMMVMHKKPDEMKRANECYKELTDVFCEHGYLPYRTNVGFMEYTLNKLDPVFRETCLKIKRALDPNGIIAPGKSGLR
jgi:4-cresol dehydrogenase (hydroxylating) flavoprotein subunit